MFYKYILYNIRKKCNKIMKNKNKLKYTIDYKKKIKYIIKKSFFCMSLPSWS